MKLETQLSVIHIVKFTIYTGCALVLLKEANTIKGNTIHNQILQYRMCEETLQHKTHSSTAHALIMRDILYKILHTYGTLH